MKTKAYIAASSLLESVIAIAIISGCLLVGLQVFSSINNSTPPIDYYNQQQHLRTNLANLTLPEITRAKGYSINTEKANTYIESTQGNLQTLRVESAYKGVDTGFNLWILNTNTP